MSKFNKTTNSKVKRVNEAGGISYDRKNIKKEIAAVILNSMLNGDSTYETEKERLKNLKKMVKKNSNDIEKMKFLAKTIVYTRNELGLRSITHFLAVTLNENVKGKSFVRKAIEKSIVRPDDMTEMFALYRNNDHKDKMPNAMRKAFKSSLETKFDT